MVIAFAGVMAEQGVYYQDKLFPSCMDIDPVAAHMCYLQLSYQGIPAEVVIANTLTLNVDGIMVCPGLAGTAGNS